jgi:hypothetical protein
MLRKVPVCFLFLVFVLSRNLGRVAAGIYVGRIAALKTKQKMNDYKTKQNKTKQNKTKQNKTRTITKLH